MSKYTELITNYHATKPKFLAHVDSDDPAAY